MRTGRTIHGIAFGEDTSHMSPRYRGRLVTVGRCIIDGIPENPEDLMPVVGSEVPELDSSDLLEVIHAGITEVRQAREQK